jgi:hypothetical protein
MSLFPIDMVLVNGVELNLLAAFEFLWVEHFWIT